MTIVSRLTRYDRFIEDEYIQGFLKGHEYSLDDVNDRLTKRIVSGQFKRIVFTGMGCSAIVSDVIRGYLIERGIEIDVYVVNDYDFRFLLSDSIVHDESTLIIISSYSGHSNEPIIALRQLLPVRERVLLLTSGGRLAEIGKAEDVSIIYWRLSNPDREYPLFHVTQYFAILVNVFVEFGLLDEEHIAELPVLADQLRADFDEHRRRAREIASVSHDANIVLIATPKWHESLLKLCKMHLNEIAMVPATRNFFHEFCHSEVASLSNPERKHSLLIFSDTDSDDYTKEKTDNLVRLLTDDRPENDRVVVNRVELNQPDFLRKFFAALNLIQQLTLELGRRTNTASRELISEAAGNPWYHSTTISAERLAS